MILILIAGMITNCGPGTARFVVAFAQTRATESIVHSPAPSRDGTSTNASANVKILPSDATRLFIRDTIWILVSFMRLSAFHRNLFLLFQGECECRNQPPRAGCPSGKAWNRTVCDCTPCLHGCVSLTPAPVG